MKKSLLIATFFVALLSHTILFAFPLGVHWIYAKGPNTLELEDRSIWEIPGSDNRIVDSWKNNDPLLITPYKGWFGNPYYNVKITNEKNKTIVYAHIQEGPERRGVYSHWLTIVNPHGGLILENNTQWDVHPKDRGEIQDWAPDDGIFILLEENQTAFYYGEEFDYSFFNIRTNSKVRVRQF